MLLLLLIVATLLKIISAVTGWDYFDAFIICVRDTLRCRIIIADKVDGKHGQIRR
jgi:hypothetical protein